MIFYFSATGNSQFAAQSLSKALGERIVDIGDHNADLSERIADDSERIADIGKQNVDAASSINADESIGFVFPIYGWDMPEIVKAFIHSFSKPSGAQGSENKPYDLQDRFIWAVVTCGDDIGMADRRIRRALEAAGLHLDAIFSITMPNTYVCLPGFDVDKAEIRRHKLEKCSERLSRIAETICKRKQNTDRRNQCRDNQTQIADKRPQITDVVRGAFPRFKTYVLGSLFHRFLITDRPFYATETCTRCGLCARLCPLSNISVSPAAPPHWHGRCTGCLKCYHHCPVRAIRFGRLTNRKGQYTLAYFSGELNDIPAR